MVSKLLVTIENNAHICAILVLLLISCALHGGIFKNEQESNKWLHDTHRYLCSYYMFFMFWAL